MNKFISICFTLLISMLPVFAQQGISFQDNWWRPYGDVYQIKKNGNAIYVCGSFFYYGPNEPNGSAINSNNSTPDFSFVNPNGTVNVSIPDGEGGWYIGGDFTMVGGQIRNHLARIKSDGTLHPFNPSVTSVNNNPAIYSLLIYGSRLYIGGRFDTVSGQIRHKIAAIDTLTGNLSTWNPNLDNAVYAIVPNGNIIYAGGDFNYVGGQNRNNIAAIDTTTGNPTTWNPNCGNTVRTIAVNGNVVYFGGIFTTVNGYPRNKIAAVSSITGIITTWNPNSDNTVFSLVINGNKVYAGGSFTNIGGQARNRIAALDMNYGSATSWNPNSSDTVFSLAFNGSSLYVAGSFKKIGSLERWYLAALDTSTGLALSWNPIANYNCVSISTSSNGNMVYAGGRFQSIGGKRRNGIAAVDPITGIPTDWNPNANPNALIYNSEIYSFTFKDSVIYIGGMFTNIGGQSRNNLAAVDTILGNATSWNPNPNDIIKALAVDGNKVYIGGYFTNIGGASRNYLASVDASTGIANTWNPNPSSYINSIELSGNNVFVAGNFVAIGSLLRKKVAIINSISGIATNWNAYVDYINTPSVNSIKIIGNNIFIAGKYNNIGGQYRENIASLDTVIGIANSWNHNLSFGSNDYIKQIDYKDTNLYIVGDFYAYNNILPTHRVCIASLSLNSGNFTQFDPNPYSSSPIFNAYLSSILVSGSRIYIGGPYINFGSIYDRNYFTAIIDSSLLLPPTISSFAPTSGCIGSTIIISGNNFNGTVSVKIGGVNVSSFNVINNTTISATVGNGTSGPITITNLDGSITSINNFSFNNVPPVISASGPISFCNGNSVTLNANTATGNSYQWKQNGNPITGATNSTFVANTSGNYTVTVTSTSCVATSNPIVVTVIPIVTPTISINTGTTNICSGTSVTFTSSITNGGNTPTYQWYVNSVPIAGESNATYTTNSLSNGQSVTCMLISSASCLSSNNIVSNSITMIVNNSVTPTITISTPNTSICIGNSVTFSSSITNGGSLPSYQWKINGNSISGATNISFTTSSITNNDIVSCILNSNANCSLSNTATSNSIVMSVSSGVNPTITINTPSNSICSGASVTFTSNITNGGSTPIYQWKNNGSVVVGATNSSFTTNTLANNNVVTCVLTSSLSCAISNPVTSNSITMMVNLAVTPTISINTISSTICTGTSVTFSTTITNGGSTPAYQWQINGINVTGATNTSYTSSTLNNGDVVSCVLTSSISCVSANPVNSNNITMTVNPIVTPTITISTTSTTVCAGASANFTSSITNGGSSPVYQWKVNGTAITGATNSSYTTSTLTNGQVVSCVLTSNATCPTSSTATSNNLTMTVNANVTPTVSISASANNICSGTSVTFTSTINNGGSSPTYQWYMGGFPSSPIAGATNSSFTSSSLSNGNAIYCVLTSSLACVTTNLVPSNTITMIVSNAVTPTIGINASATNICAGSSVTFTASITNGGGSPAYQWKLNGTSITGATNTSYSSTTLSNSDVISCSLTSNVACVTANPVSSNNITMTVNTVITPVIIISPTNASLCVGISETFTAATNVIGGSYQWKVNGINVGANSPSYTYIPVNNDQISCVLTSPSGCYTTTSTNSNILTLTVSPNITPTISISAGGNNICYGVTVNYTASTNISGGSYQWKVNGSNAGTNSATFNYMPSNGDVISCIITVPSTGCFTSNTATSNNITMIVTASTTPTLSISASNNNVCSGTNVSFTSTTNITGGTYQWKVNGSNVGTNSATYNYVPVNGDIVTCELTTPSSACYYPTSITSNAVTMNIIALTIPTASITGNSTVCAGANTTYTATTNVVTGAAYQWMVNNLNVGTNSNSYSYVPTNNDQVKCVITTPTGCFTVTTATSNIITISVQANVTPTIAIAAGGNNVCAGTNVNFTANTNVGGGSYQWKVNGTNVGVNSSTYSYTPANNDIVSCDLTVPSGGCYTVNIVSSNTVLMTVDPMLTPSISLTGPVNAHLNDVVTVNANITNGPSSYSLDWKNNGVSFSTTSVPSVTYNKPAGNDLITASLTPLAGCYNNTTSSGHAVSLIVGINDVDNEVLFSVSPNPFKDELLVNCLHSGGKLRLTDAVGKIIGQWEMKDGKTGLVIDTKAIAQGLYLLQYINDNTHAVVKVVKE